MAEHGPGGEPGPSSGESMRRDEKPGRRLWASKLGDETWPQTAEDWRAASVAPEGRAAAEAPVSEAALAKVGKAEADLAKARQIAERDAAVGKLVGERKLPRRAFGDRLGRRRAEIKAQRGGDKVAEAQVALDKAYKKAGGKPEPAKVPDYYSAHIDKHGHGHGLGAGMEQTQADQTLYAADQVGVPSRPDSEPLPEINPLVVEMMKTSGELPMDHRGEPPLVPVPGAEAPAVTETAAEAAEPVEALHHEPAETTESSPMPAELARPTRRERARARLNMAGGVLGQAGGLLGSAVKQVEGVIDTGVKKGVNFAGNRVLKPGFEKGKAGYEKGKGAWVARRERKTGGGGADVALGTLETPQQFQDVVTHLAQIPDIDARLNGLRALLGRAMEVSRRGGEPLMIDAPQGGEQRGSESVMDYIHKRIMAAERELGATPPGGPEA